MEEPYKAIQERHAPLSSTESIVEFLKVASHLILGGKEGRKSPHFQYLAVYSFFEVAKSS